MSLEIENLNSLRDIPLNAYLPDELKDSDNLLQDQDKPRAQAGAIFIIQNLCERTGHFMLS
jgi:hypothetical protein